MPCGGCAPRGWRGAVPGGVACHCCDCVRRCPSPGRPSSGAGGQGSAIRVSRVRSVRAWRPSTGPTACALAGRRCSLWGWLKGIPGGVAFHHCEGRLGSGAVPLPTARPLGGLLGSATHVLWARVCGCGSPTPSPRPACPVGAACHSRRGAVPGGGGLPPLSGAPGVRRCPSSGRPSSGAGSQGYASCVSQVQSVRAWGPSTGPTACALAGRRCSLWGWRKGVPRQGAFHHCEGRLGSGAVPPLTARPLGGLLGSATHVLWVPVCWCGGPTLSPWPACPVGAACREGGGGRPRGGWPATVVSSTCCQALSLPRLPVPWSGQPGFRNPCVPGAVDAGVGTEQRPHSVRACGPALLAVGVAEGRPRGGCLPPL